MLKIDGKEVNTVEEAKKALKVSAKTIGEWIRSGILPEPPVVYYGTREIRTFPEDYLIKAQECIDNHRKKKNSQKQQA